MEGLKSSSTSDFQFKHIPKKQFEEMVTRVRQERKTKDEGMWGSFCSVTSGGDSVSKPRVVKASKPLTDEEVRSFVSSIKSRSSSQFGIPPSDAPFFGPARQLHVEPKEQEISKPSTSSSDASTIPSVHISEVVHVYPQTSGSKIQVQNQDDNTSEFSIVEEEESLESEMIKLCSEIENANGVAESDGGDESSVDLTYQEEKCLQNIVDKSEEKLLCEKYNKFIDKKFDFLYEECEKLSEDDDEANAILALPVVELKKRTGEKKKLHPDGDFTTTNDNNVWIPKTQNQIKKSGKRQEHETSGVRKKRNDDVFPSDVIIRKVSEVGKLKRDVNEKSQVDVASSDQKSDEKRRKEIEEVLPSRDDILIALGRVSEYQSKICKFLDYLREIIEDPPEIEDMNDLKKRQQRAMEFSNRFARNHLYQIGRIAEEISVMLDNPVDIASKVIQLFQVIMQSVQIYLKNVEMFIYNKYPDKLSILINFIINAVTICFERLIFDKRDVTVQQLLRKCSDMKKYLEMNQQSLAKFVSIKEKRKMSLHARSSFAYENNYGTKLAMYDAPTKPLRPRKTNLPMKSPYDSLLPRNLKSSHSSVTTKQKLPLSRVQSRIQSRMKSPNIKKSPSNVSTAVQRLKASESNEIIKSVSEKPFEENESAAPSREKENEIMEMMQNIAKEKIQEMLAPFLNELKKSLPSDDKPKHEQFYIDGPTEPIATTLPLPRVTSEVKKPQKEKSSTPENAKCSEKVHNVSKNVQYLYVKSNEEKKNSSVAQSKPTASKNQQEQSIATQPNPVKAPEMKMVSPKVKPPIPVKKNELDDKFVRKMKEQALKERLEYVEQMMENPLYVNETFNEPWKMFARISDKLVDEMLQSVVSELDLGEKTFVESFLRHELNC